MMNTIVKKEKLFESPIEKVWSAITDSKEIEQWLLPNNFKAKKGHKFHLIYENEEKVTGEILEVEKPNKLVYTWIVKGSESVITTVSWDLTKKDTTTTNVSLVHTGFEGYGDAITDYMNHTTQGWQRCFDDLLKYLNERN